MSVAEPVPARLAPDAGKGGAVPMVERGLQELQQARFGPALACFEHALQRDPHDLRALHHRAQTLGLLQRYEEALAGFERVLLQQPADAEAQIGCGIAQFHLGRLPEALARFEQALAQQPQHAGALYQRALCLAALDRLEVALPCFDAALAVYPQHPDLLFNRGVVLEKLNRRQEARHSYDQVLKQQPDHADAHFNRSLIDLGWGRLREGWRDYALRWRSTPFRNSRLQSAAPPWLGGVSVHGRTILLYNEQGVGDAIQALRYVPLVARLGARVVLVAPASLHRLLQSVHGVERIVADEYPLPAHDLHCALMDLPLVFGSTLETIPASVPYLAAEAGDIERWRVRLGPARRPRVGLVWAGRQYPPVIPHRDTDLCTLRPLLDHQAAEWVSLQKEIPQRDRALLAVLPQLVRHGETLSDFADAAALIANLDLVIAVDTALAHLAGALGKPVWLLNRYASCWRWMEQGSDTPWYPTMTIFRQEAMRDWDSVVRKLAAALPEFLSSAPLRQGLD